MSKLVSEQPGKGSAEGRRAASKDRTRRKIMAAAKHLFSTFGYDRTTIREIAAEAGVSTGAVFVTFVGKSDLFHALVVEDRVAAYEIVGDTLREQLKDPDVEVEDVLRAMFENAYRSRAENVPFIQVAMSAAWSTELGPDIRKLLAQWPISGLIGEALQAAIDRGQLSADADIPLLSQMLWDSALGMIPHAVFDAWPAAKLGERLAEKVGAILAGSRLRPAS